MTPPATFVAAIASYAWLGLSAWVLLAPNNSAPSLVKGAWTFCWLMVGLWVWERTDDGKNDLGLLFRFCFTILMGAAAMCFAFPLALIRQHESARES